MGISQRIILKTWFIPLALKLFFLISAEANASWWVDAQRFHISSHGQTSCQDCHQDVKKRTIHPDPSHVNGSPDVFSKEQRCFVCHDNIQDDLERGFHGSERVENPRTYDSCLHCHAPHYQLRTGDEDRFDPDRAPSEQCGVCHEWQSGLSPFLAEDIPCMACHRSLDANDPAGQEKTSRFCFHCHSKSGTPAQKMTGEKVPLIKEEEYQETPHREIVCTACHPEAMGSGHGKQLPGNCGQCHLRHDEKVAHDVHIEVSCQACHLEAVRPTKDQNREAVLWERVQGPGDSSRIHDMARTGHKSACRRCHFEGNQLGAVSMVLPAKSILCMPCHTATFSAGDMTTVLALFFLLAGLVINFSYWLSGTMPGGGDRLATKLFKLLIHVFRTLFSWRIYLALKAMFLDVLFQRRLLKHSRTRWLIHNLIFLPFVFRFLWGLTALSGSLWKPQWPLVWSMLDKNNPATAFLFDLSGVMVITGIVLAIIRGMHARTGRAPGLPGQDLVALGLIGGVIVTGFVVEGMRISMTGYPMASKYAFLGYAVSQLFSSPSGLTETYGYLWYSHAVLTGAFAAYLPFSRLFHIFAAPVVLVANAVSKPVPAGRPD